MGYVICSSIGCCYCYNCYYILYPIITSRDCVFHVKTVKKFSFLTCYDSIFFPLFLFLFDLLDARQRGWSATTTTGKNQTNQLACSHNNQVYIVGHMPPGSDERQLGIQMNGHTTFSSENNLRYLQLVRKYSSIISGQFFGHLHSDSFRIIYSDNGKHIFDLFEFAFILHHTAVRAAGRIFHNRLSSLFLLLRDAFDMVASRIQQWGWEVGRLQR